MSDASTPEHGEVLSFGDPAHAPSEGASAPGSGSGRRLWPFAVGGVAALAVGGAGVALGLMVGGGGVQPEDVMPAGAVMYADIDFDPGADQKLNMMRMLNEFPDVREELGGRDDIRAWMLEEVFASSEFEAADQWVGDRAGMGLVWDGPGSGPTFVVAVEVTDQSAAEQTLLEEFEAEEVAFDQGYAIVAISFSDEEMGFGVAEGQTAAEVVASAQSASLAADADFVAAMDPLGSGLASGYVDGAGFTDMVEDQLSGLMMGMYQSQIMGQELDGVTAVVLKAEPDAFALDGYSTQSGLTNAATPTQLMRGLPDSTIFALAFTGGGETGAMGWQNFLDQMEQLSEMTAAEFESMDQIAVTDQTAAPDSFVEREIQKFENEYNVQLPEDLITLLGDDAVIAVDGDDLVTSPGLGYRVVSDPAAAADLAARLQPVLDEVTGGFGASVRATDDGLVIASTPEYADVLVGEPGGLLDDPRAQAALVDVESASSVVWVDLDEASSLARLLTAEAADVLEPMSALGMTVVPDGEGWSLHARLTFDE